jgi:hypothetical protein
MSSISTIVFALAEANGKMWSRLYVLFTSRVATAVSGAIFCVPGSQAVPPAVGVRGNFTHQAAIFSAGIASS